jgi:hypothetical protein
MDEERCNCKYKKMYWGLYNKYNNKYKEDKLTKKIEELINENVSLKNQLNDKYPKKIYDDNITNLLNTFDDLI